MNKLKINTKDYKFYVPKEMKHLSNIKWTKNNSNIEIDLDSCNDNQKYWLINYVYCFNEKYFYNFSGGRQPLKRDISILLNNKDIINIDYYPDLDKILVNIEE